jgi:hypothetical protein
MQPNTKATGKWTLEEDAKLISALTETCKKKQFKEQSIDWIAVAALVSSQTNTQCRRRWRDGLDIDRASGRTGEWTKGEFIMLTRAVQIYGGGSWGEIAALVPGRTKKQCWKKCVGTDGNLPQISETAQ